MNITPEWHDSIDEAAFEWLASTVKGWDDLTEAQATAWWVSLLDTIESDLTAADGDGAFEVSASKSVTGQPATFVVYRREVAWALTRAENEGGATNA